MASVEELAKEIQQDMEIAMLNTVHVFAEACTHVCLQRLQALREQLLADPEHVLQDGSPQSTTFFELSRGSAPCLPEACQDEATDLEAMYGGLDSSKYIYRKDPPKDVEHEEVNGDADILVESVPSEAEPQEMEQLSAQDDVCDIIGNEEAASQPARVLLHHDVHDIMGYETESNALDIGTSSDAIKFMHIPSAATWLLPRPCRTRSNEANENNKTIECIATMDYSKVRARWTAALAVVRMSRRLLSKPTREVFFTAEDVVGREAATLAEEEEFEAALAKLGDKPRHLSTSSRAEVTSIWDDSSAARARWQTAVRAVQISRKTLSKRVGTVSFRVEDVVGQEATHEAEEREFERVMERLGDRKRRLSTVNTAEVPAMNAFTATGWCAQMDQQWGVEGETSGTPWWLMPSVHAWFRPLCPPVHADAHELNEDVQYEARLTTPCVTKDWLLENESMYEEAMGQYS